jgi:hypothetical protein
VSDEFDYWLGTTFLRCQKDEVAGGWEVEVSRIALPRVLSAGQAWRAAVYLLRLSGHAPGPLPGELEAIRARAEATEGVIVSARHGGWVGRAVEDRAALLRALDSALADLAAAEGALADLCSPQSGEANAAYLRGRDDGVRRCVAELRAEVTRLREIAGDGSSGAHAETRELCLLRAVTVEMLARRVESPAAPAAGPGGE